MKARAVGETRSIGGHGLVVAFSQSAAEVLTDLFHRVSYAASIGSLPALRNFAETVGGSRY